MNPLFGALIEQDASLPLVQFFALKQAIDGKFVQRADELLVGDALIHGHRIGPEKVMDLWQPISGSFMRRGSEEEVFCNCAPGALLMADPNRWTSPLGHFEFIRAGLQRAIERDGRVPIIGTREGETEPLDFFSMVYALHFDVSVLNLNQLGSCMSFIGERDDPIWFRPEVHRSIKKVFASSIEASLAGPAFTGRLEAPMRFLKTVFDAGALQAHSSGALGAEGEGTLLAHRFEADGHNLLQILCEVEGSRRRLAFECVDDLLVAANQSGYPMEGRSGLVNQPHPESGDTPLHLACASFNVDLIELLLKAGASALLKNHQGLRPFDRAQAACSKNKLNKIEHVASILRAAEAHEEAFQLVSEMSSRPAIGSGGP